MPNKEIHKQLKLAVIDMNDGSPNQGMRGIIALLKRYEGKLSYQIFDIRQKGEVPDLSYDVFISSGGPGSPFEGEGQNWENDFFKLLDDIDNYNQSHQHKKHAFLICHSFQLACRKYGLGEVIQRKSNAFGIFPMNLTLAGEEEELFNGLTNPFYSVDSRDWQVIKPNEDRFKAKGAKILVIEKDRPHVNLERCLMAIRFSGEIIGTQFHPEADPVGMKTYFLQPEKRAEIIKSQGEDKYNDMLNSLDDPDKITLTQNVILPNFLNKVIQLNLSGYDTKISSAI